MSNEPGKRLTLEERMNLAANSRASSPEAAFKLVEQFSQLHAREIFAFNDNIRAMGMLIGTFMDDPTIEIERYRGFAPCFRLAIEDYVKTTTEGKQTPYHLTWGTNACNALILLGLMMLDHAKNRMKRKFIYPCTRMTLEQYLEAAPALIIRNSVDRERQERFNRWKDAFLRDYDGSLPLADGLSAIMGRYFSAWAVLDRLDFVMCCLGNLGCTMFDELSAHDFLTFRAAMYRYGWDSGDHIRLEPNKSGRNHEHYYLNLARNYSPHIPDLDGDDLVSKECLRAFLHNRDFHPDTLQAVVKESPSLEMWELLQENIDEEHVANAMHEINAVVTDLYMLFVEPYLQTEKQG